MLSAVLLTVMTTGVVHAGAQDCGHGYAACNYGYGFTQRACLSCQHGPGCTPTRPFNYRIAMDYPWTIPSYPRAKALMLGAHPLGCAISEEPSDEVRIDDSARVTPPIELKSSRRRYARATPVSTATQRGSTP